MPLAPQITTSRTLSASQPDAPLIAPPSGALGHLVIKGELEFLYTGQRLDAAHADEPGSLIQIEPGAWRIVRSDPSSHAYAFEPIGEVQGDPRVTLELDQLVEQHLLSPREVRDQLTGELRIEAGFVPLAVPPWRPGPAEYAGLGLALFMVVMALARAVRARRLQTADLRRELNRIRAAGRALERTLQRHTGIDADARARIPPLLETAEKLSAATRKLRRRLQRAGAARLQRELEALNAAGEAGPDSVLAEKQRTLALLEPLIVEERTLTARLERIRTTLEALEAAWVVGDTPASRQTAQKAEEQLERVSNEVQAALATRREMGPY